uniref:Uncharacterized protein n=1 Tax=Candidatus Kentrum sp. FW TaxID=2126338 RepID=A0A450T855_9GAMM|nr:MAG: hypothetical protein BECKFW1821C_GA0114237_10035 [Candidatus Kentron sp. FW]
MSTTTSGPPPGLPAESGARGRPTRRAFQGDERKEEIRQPVGNFARMARFAISACRGRHKNNRHCPMRPTASPGSRFALCPQAGKRPGINHVRGVGKDKPDFRVRICFVDRLYGTNALVFLFPRQIQICGKRTATSKSYFQIGLFDVVIPQIGQAVMTTSTRSSLSGSTIISHGWWLCRVSIIHRPSTASGR